MRPCPPLTSIMSVPAAPISPSLPSVDPSDLKVSRLRALRGPNFWRLSPVVACEVRLGALEDVPTNLLPGFSERLLATLPSLRGHPCARGTGRFVERLDAGTHLPHVLEHVALELQTLAGDDIHFGRVIPSGDDDVWWLVVGYEHEEVGLESVRDAVQLVQHCLAPDAFDTPCNAAEVVARLQELQEDVRLGPSTAAIVEEARRRGIPVRRMNSSSLVQLGHGRYLRRIQSTVTAFTSNISTEIAQDKQDTRVFLESVGLPVPRGGVVRSLDAALEEAERVGYPVLLKPLNLSHGRGISDKLPDADGLRKAWPASAARSRHVIVEQFRTGRDHRVLVVNGHTVACAERVPAHVTGDGTSTVRQLIERENADPRRGRGHTNVLTYLPMDEATQEFLAARDKSLDSVPMKDEIVMLRGTANLSTGGTSIDRTDEMHPDNATACEMAASIIGLDVAGIDVLTDDIGVPFRENGGVMIEVNAGPGVRMHTHPTVGTPRNVAAPIVDMLYPPGSPSTIPIIAITGTNGKTTTTRLVAHLFRNAGAHVGFTTTDGIYLGNRLAIEGDMTGPFSANVILSNPLVDVAVLETARGGILRSGLGFDECDVGIVLNVADDHLGLGGILTVEQLAAVKSVIPSVVKRNGHAILNADDPLVLRMRDKTDGDVVLFTTRTTGANADYASHVQKGGIGGRVDRGVFVIERGALRIPVCPVGDVPLTFGGAARFQYGNVLAAMLAAYVRGMRYTDIRSGLLSFFPSPSLTPGRLNLIPLGRRRVLVDYAHNAAAVSGLLDFASALEARRRIGVIAAPGDRRDADLIALGRHAARFDRVIVREDEDLRGRAPGETAALIRQGLREGGLDPRDIEVVRDERSAIRHALNELEDEDLLVILASDVPGTLRDLRPAADGSP